MMAPNRHQSLLFQTIYIFLGGFCTQFKSGGGPFLRGRGLTDRFFKPNTLVGMEIIFFLACSDDDFSLSSKRFRSSIEKKRGDFVQG